MGLRSGLAAQLGLKDESSYGVHPGAVDVFLPLVEESMGQEINMLESAGILAGRRTRDTDQWGLGAITVGGDIGVELTNKGLRTAFKHMFGAESGSGPYTYTPGDLTGLSFAAQVGKPGTGSNVVPAMTYLGCKVASWEIGISEGEIATLGLTIIAQKEVGYRTVADGVTTDTETGITSATAAFGPDDVGKPISGTGIPANATIASVQSATAATLSAAATATGTGGTFTLGIALASASYASDILPLHYDQAVITVAGSPVKLKSVTLSGDNGITERRFLGQRTTDEPLENALRTYGGTLECEFTDRTQYQRFVNGATAALAVTLSTAAGVAVVTITENIRYDGASPHVSGPDIVGQSLPFSAVASTNDASTITAVLAAA